jgi:F-actin monooxygenase
LCFQDRERGLFSALPRGFDGQFSDRIKSMEQQIKSNKSAVHEKKPKDLLRAIGKIESNDWNVKQIERKMELSKKTTDIGKSREKVPKWNREQFLARQNKMSKADRQESVDEKYKDIDNTLKSIDKQLKEGNTLEIGERGKNKVASIAGQFKKKDDSSEEKSTGSKNAAAPKPTLMMNSAGVSEVCHFCKQRVYLMEKLSAEGLVCHRSCLKCHHCHTNLRMGGYAFDRDNPAGLFYCTQHFRLPPKEIKLPVKRHLPRLSATGKAVVDVAKKPQEQATPEKHGITTLDLLDRGQTPERIEFENVDAMSDGEPSLENIIDENEWTDRNFGTGSEDSDLSR